jgi:hypothetical protein
MVEITDTLLNSAVPCVASAPLAQLTLNQFSDAGTPKKIAHFEECASPGAAHTAGLAPLPADLAAVIDAWPALPKPVKAGILAMVETAISNG